ncbi:MAG: MBOAT family protein [Dysgonamonadaceae bacterium]|jgi:D-alanyl-lipoteichoic acid acyltransferase DltB (MBOAT superfamily)|nr:MBOAT family protein [Dysgonamonadaceae bacterium]
MKELFTFDTNSPLLFTQFYFWIFFVLVFAGFALLEKKIAWRNAFLCFASLFFYYKTSGLFVLILLFTTVFNFYQAKFIHRASTEKRQRMYLWIGLAGNLFFLCYFKYAYFITDILNNWLGIHLRIFDAFAWAGNILGGKERFNVSDILLPVGISFYTFQNISYLMDVFRKRIRPVKEILNFGFYVTFFPQLVAGPIVRASEFVPQIYKPYHLGRKQFGLAVFWILNGLAKKIILSDYIAVNFVDRVFDNPTMFSGFENLVALFGYSLQVYADFSGYTDIAIGVAMLMGFYLPKNFNSPYKATNPGDFWKRWHISLSNWLKDYLYIPLGGNRNTTFATYSVIVTIGVIAVILSGSGWVGLFLFLTMGVVSYTAYTYPQSRKKINTNLNLMNTMLLGGLWHGASWNFVIWGGLNGIGIVLYKFWKNWNPYLRVLILFTFTLFFLSLSLVFSSPVLNISVVWLSLVFAGTVIQLFYHDLKERHFISKKYSFRSLETAWAVLQTFVFISFTRLFFRSGSNLDPAEANRIAWDTAKNMVNRIGSPWDVSQTGAIVHEYRYIFSLIIIGLIIHWLPEKCKRRYRLSFAQMPLPAMVVFVVVSVFIIYQFITADLQAFIYFQF